MPLIFDHPKFAGEMKKRRMFHGYSQEKLADILDIPPVRIQNLECTARRRPGASDVAAVCYLLGMEMQDFLDATWRKQVSDRILRRANRAQL